MDLFSDRKVYRKSITNTDLTFYRVTHGPTDLYVGSEKNYHDIVLAEIVKVRKILDEHIANNPKFLESLVPIGYNEFDNIIVKEMCIAAGKAGVGPMATVAGVFNRQAYNSIKMLSSQVVIENGGDVFCKTKERITCGLYAGKSPLNMKLGVKVSGDYVPYGVCSSAKTIGHSLSFGNADLAMVICEDVLLADGLATKLGNMIKTKKDLKSALEYVYDHHEILGAAGIIESDIALVGDLDIVHI
jgi:ApbE superfamily uncharacterized protein (UPF0280 family)